MTAVVNVIYLKNLARILWPPAFRSEFRFTMQIIPHGHIYKNLWPLLLSPDVSMISGDFVGIIFTHSVSIYCTKEQGKSVAISYLNIQAKLIIIAVRIFKNG